MEQDYDARRETLYSRTQGHLAAPVGWLVAVAYEPRVRGQRSTAEFDNLVEARRRMLRDELIGRTRRDGGAIEAAAREVAHALLNEAERHNFEGSAELLRAALDHCDGWRRPEVVERLRLPEPQRVIGASGKPIGLWR